MINIGLWCGLAVLILFVVITSCIVKSKKDKLEDLTNQNQQIEDRLEKDESEQNN